MLKKFRFHVRLAVSVRAAGHSSFRRDGACRRRPSRLVDVPGRSRLDRPPGEPGLASAGADADRVPHDQESVTIWDEAVTRFAPNRSISNGSTPISASGCTPTSSMIASISWTTPTGRSTPWSTASDGYGSLRRRRQFGRSVGAQPPARHADRRAAQGRLVLSQAPPTSWSSTDVPPWSASSRSSPTPARFRRRGAPNICMSRCDISTAISSPSWA